MMLAAVLTQSLSKALSRPPIQRLARWLTHLLSAWAMGWLAWRVYIGNLGANPVETLEHTSGHWSLYLLLASLAASPLTRLTAIPFWRQLRRPLGLWAFAYACVHVAAYLVFDHEFDLAAIQKDVIRHPRIGAGAVAFLLLVPLAVTSTKRWQRRLGRSWAKLHKLAYAASAAGVVHYLWLVKADFRAPLAWGLVWALLMGWRLPAKKKISAPA